MNDFETMKKMLSTAKVTEDYTIHCLEEGWEIIIYCSDDWYNMHFYFDKSGRLVRVN